MKKKQSRIAEAATPYPAKKPAKAAPANKSNRGSAGEAAFKRIADKIFTERKELLRKLAQ